MSVSNISYLLGLKLDVQASTSVSGYPSCIFLATRDPNSVSATTVPIKYLPCGFGLVSDEITFTDSSGAIEAISVPLQIFIDPMRIEFLQPSQSDICTIPTVLWDLVYLYKTESGFYEIISRPKKSIEFRNITEESISIACTVDGPLSIELSSNTGIGLQTTEIMTSHQKKTITLQLQTPTLTKENIDLIEQGKLLQIQGHFAVRDENGEILKICYIHAKFGLSRYEQCRFGKVYFYSAELTPSVLDLGKVGFLEPWDTVPFSFVINNR